MITKNKESLINLLFDTKALQVSEASKPFWYTSGMVGPYYVNTHFLLNGQSIAEELLSIIDQNKDKPIECSHIVTQFLLEQYEKPGLYKKVIDLVVDQLKTLMTNKETPLKFISGGERRDWYFSVVPAKLLGLPHLYLFKNQQAIFGLGDEYSHCSLESYTQTVKGAYTVHIVDLITKASSYFDYWIPALEKLDIMLKDSITIINRNESGNRLENAGYNVHSLATIDLAFFERACSQDLISKEQHQLVSDYLKNPYMSMKAFIKSHPGFIVDSYQEGGKLRTRVEKFFELNPYDFSEEFIRDLKANCYSSVE